MSAKEIRAKFLAFFESKGHAVIPSAPLVPEHDPTVLFNTAGMQPLVPYLLGEKHPLGKRLVDCQKCLRTVELDEENSIGDKTHHTFFEMLGNWSLGDYFKEGSIAYSWEFLTSKEWLALDPKKIYVTVFVGDEQLAYDEEAARLWKEQFAKAGIEAKVWGKEEEDGGEFRIFPLGKKDNWWSLNKDNGPCGPDTEIFYYTAEGAPDLNQERPGFKDDNFVEIWNNVFMEFEVESKEGKTTLKNLKQKNIDTGMGLERITAVLMGESDNYKTDLFWPIVEKAEVVTQTQYGEEEKTTRALRVIVDHVRATIFLLGDGVLPSNTDQGYVLRRLIRRAIRQIRSLRKTKEGDFVYSGGYLRVLAEVALPIYVEAYPNLAKQQEEILKEIDREEEGFLKTLERGLKLFAEVVTKLKQEGKKKIEGEVAFDLYQTYGFPLEILQEMAEEEGIAVDEEGFGKQLAAHKDLSRTAAQKRFRGGLANAKEITVRMHTATHLLLAGLRKILGPEVHQRGSNITEERIRFDFSWKEKMTPEQKLAVEDFVNQAIKADVEITMEEMSLKEAQEAGAEGVFVDRYNEEKVKVYTIPGFSKEICGGPHVKRTGEIGSFKIIKEEASSAGVRRIKAVIS